MNYGKSLQMLINEAMSQEPPTTYEERALYWKIQNGVPGAKDELVTRNMRFVMHLAKRFTNQGVDLLDLIQEGAVAMCLAADKWTPARGMKFTGYASWYIKNALKALLCQTGTAVTLPKINYSHSKAKAQLAIMQSELGRLPTNAEFKAKTGMAGHAGSVATVLCQPRKSLEDDTGLDPSMDSPRNRVIDENANTAAFAERNSEREWLESMMDELSDRERDVIMKRFGWNDDVEMILDDIAGEHGITRERIRQIQNEALYKMKRAIARADINALVIGAA